MVSGRNDPDWFWNYQKFQIVDTIGGYVVRDYNDLNDLALDEMFTFEDRQLLRTSLEMGEAINKGRLKGFLLEPVGPRS